MTEPDDRAEQEPGEGELAPVTWLFGRSSGEAGSRARHPSRFAAAPANDAPAQPRDEWAQPRDEWAQTRDDSMNVSPQARDEAVEDDPDERIGHEARDRAIRALGRKAMSQREIERMLVADLVPEPVVTEVVDRLVQDGHLDDTALAQELVGRLQERKGLGRTAIAAELARRMLAPMAISYALELVDTGDELARAREVASKRAAQLRGLDRETAVRRLSGYLQRRGYTGSTVRAAVDGALPEQRPGSSVRFR